MRDLYLYEKVAEKLKAKVEKNGYVDIGTGVELEYCCSRKTIMNAADLLHQNLGYTIVPVSIINLRKEKGPRINVSILFDPSKTRYGEIFRGKKKIETAYWKRKKKEEVLREKMA